MRFNEIDVNLGGGSLLQVATRCGIQMMSYFLETPDGKTVVIDGGHYFPEDAEYLHSLIAERGGRVDLWLFTHAHDDHFGALCHWLENHDELDFTIEKMLFSFPPTDWFKGVENGNSHKLIVKFLEQLDRHGIQHRTLNYQDIIECGGMSFEILNDCRNYEDYRTINDTTCVILAHFPKRDVLFLGDLGEAGGQYLLENFAADKIRCDIVQLAHHGQNGVNRAFYERVKPKVCLYTAPDWLWENNNGGGKGSGPWATLETRKWMAELGAQVSCPCAYGDYLLK